MNLLIFEARQENLLIFGTRREKICSISFFEPGFSLHCGCRCKYVNWCFIPCMLKPHPLSYLCSLQYSLRTYDYHNFFKERGFISTYVLFTENCRGNFRSLSVLASIPLGAWGTHLQAAGFSLRDVSIPLFIFDISVYLWIFS